MVSAPESRLTAEMVPVDAVTAERPADWDIDSR